MSRPGIQKGLSSFILLSTQMNGCARPKRSYLRTAPSLPMKGEKSKVVVVLGPGYGFMIRCLVWADWWVISWVESWSFTGLQGAEWPQCPRATLPGAVCLAARYIKTGASVTESALWKLRGLVDGHFWRCRSIIKMKSSDWAGLACSVAQKSSTLPPHIPPPHTLSLSPTGYWGSGRLKQTYK